LVVTIKEFRQIYKIINHPKTMVKELPWIADGGLASFEESTIKPDTLVEVLEGQPVELFIRKHPEYSKFYQAIDGIENRWEKKQAIRSDILELLKLDSKKFHKWYFDRKDITTELLDKYQKFCSIPRLNVYDRNLDMSYSKEVGALLHQYKLALEYLDKIKNLYDEVHTRPKPMSII